MENIKPKINWRIPLYGAIGFIIGEIIVDLIDLFLTISRIIVPTIELSIEYIITMVIMSAIKGSIGSAALGLALKDKKKILYLSLAGAIGFAIAGIIRCTIGLGIIALIVRNAIVGILLGLALIYTIIKEEN
jgi:hypothetical protein